MKSKHTIYIALMIIAAFTACKKDSFLNRGPLSDIAPTNFFNNENDLKLYCNTYYTNLPVQSFTNADGQSDDKANTSINTFLAGTYTIPQSASAGTYASGWDFRQIRKYNYFLANYAKANASAPIKNNYVGETLFFRGLNFWNLVKRFGDVPYVNKYIVDTTNSVLYGARMPHKQVMDSVLKDINFAVANIPASTPDGRLNKYHALALKARICLWEGTYRKYHSMGDETPFLQAAADAAQQIRESGLFRIYRSAVPNPQTDYYNLFIQRELKTNAEAIMPMRYLANILTNNTSRQLGEAGDGYTKDFVRSYLCTDGLPTSLSPLYKGDNTPEDEATNRDPRYKQTIATRGFNFLDGDLITLPRIGTPVTSTGYQPIKGRSSSLADWNANQSELDFFIFRYAETLLIEAEAKQELGTLNQGLLDLTINQLRDRVGMPHMTMSPTPDPKLTFPGVSSVLLAEIRRERRIELASDGFRYDDLQRWKAGTLINNPETILGMKLTPALRAQYPSGQVSNVVVDANNYIRVYPAFSNRTWNDKMYLFPIPIDQLSLNPQLKQNPGWN